MARWQAWDRADALVGEVFGRSRGGRDGASVLAGFTAAEWLLLDAMARAYAPYRAEITIAGRRWWNLDLAGDATLGTVLASMHSDGRLRERATVALGVATSTAESAASELPSHVIDYALALRLLDHVPQVRQAAWSAVDSHLTLSAAATVLDLLLTARDRLRGSAALAQMEREVLIRWNADEIVSALSRYTNRRSLRRWLWDWGHAHGALSGDQLLAVVHENPDQWLTTRCAQWFAADNPQRVGELLTARAVSARQLAVVGSTDAELSDAALATFLHDDAARIRAAARVRAGARGWDLAALYRAQLAQPGSPGKARATALEGIAVTGGDGALNLCAHYLGDESVRVRAAAVAAVATLGAPGQAVGMLVPLLLDDSTRVGSAAARALVRLGAAPALATAAWASDRPSVRRLGWRVSRAAGGWDRVESDLRAAADFDPDVRHDGRAGLGSWLNQGAADCGPSRRRTSARA